MDTDVTARRAAAADAGGCLACGSRGDVVEVRIGNTSFRLCVAECSPATRSAMMRAERERSPVFRGRRA